MLLSLPLSLLFVIDVYAQTQTSQATSTGTQVPSSIPSAGGDFVPTGTQVSYISYNTTSTVASGSLSGATVVIPTTIAVANGTNLSSNSSGSGGTSGPRSVDMLSGTRSSTNATGTSSAEPANTVPCNGHPNLCSRPYGNITYVAAHNSPFINPNNIAANQEYGVFAQLNDGIRMLQGQTHFVDDIAYYCHTSCDLLNAGTAESYFRNISQWLDGHRTEVVTLLIGNSDFRPVTDYVAPLESSGLRAFAYEPDVIPMSINDWPPLDQMFPIGQQVVIFMDYNANQTAVPWILDEFSQIWETPFSPTNSSFPCTVERPPGLSPEDAGSRMYMANHNLNRQITALGNSILVPATNVINETNAVSGDGSLGKAAEDCAGNSNHCVRADKANSRWNKRIGLTLRTSCL